MDAIAPMLAVVILTAHAGREWRSFPAEPLCEKNWWLAEHYIKEMRLKGGSLGGYQGNCCFRLADAARHRQRIWWALWWVASDEPAEVRNWWATEALRLMGGDAFYRGDWPSPIPLEHFPVHRTPGD